MLVILKCNDCGACLLENEDAVVENCGGCGGKLTIVDDEQRLNIRTEHKKSQGFIEEMTEGLQQMTHAEIRRIYDFMSGNSYIEKKDGQCFEDRITDHLYMNYFVSRQKGNTVLVKSEIRDLISEILLQYLKDEKCYIRVFDVLE